MPDQVALSLAWEWQIAVRRQDLPWDYSYIRPDLRNGTLRGRHRLVVVVAQQSKDNIAAVPFAQNCIGIELPCMFVDIVREDRQEETVDIEVGTGQDSFVEENCNCPQ